MKLIKPSFEIWEQKEGILEVLKQIERAGRICYKSEDKITNNSAKPFVDRLIESKHYAMLEHGTIYLNLIPNDDNSFEQDFIELFMNNSYSRCNRVMHSNIGYAVTTNLRVIMDNHLEEALKYLCEPTKYHTKRVTVHFTLSRQIAMEFIRHRVFSFAMESTRYCNYTKDKFGNELVFIEPLWCDYTKEYLDESDESYLTRNIYKAKDTASLVFKEELERIEETYFNLIANGWKPQQAATILPNAIKTELVMTGFIDDWKHFFNLRALGTTGAPHPQAKELAAPLYDEFCKLYYIK